MSRAEYSPLRRNPHPRSRLFPDPSLESGHRCDSFFSAPLVAHHLIDGLQRLGARQPFLLLTSSGVGRLVWLSESPVSLLDQSHVPKIEGACHLAPIAGMECSVSPNTEIQREA